jgi:putative flippase GtrA
MLGSAIQPFITVSFSRLLSANYGRSRIGLDGYLLAHSILLQHVNNMKLRHTLMEPSRANIWMYVGAAMNLFCSLQLVRFCLVGISNTAVGLLIIYTLKWLGNTDFVANIAGYSVGVISSFGFNKNLTFAYSGAAGTAAIKFLVVFGIAYALNIGLVLILVYYCSVDGYIAQALGLAPYAVVFFFGSRYFAFRS